VALPSSLPPPFILLLLLSSLALPPTWPLLHWREAPIAAAIVYWVSNAC
jgi:hypothetical protein